MKKLIVSVKPPGQLLREFETSIEAAAKGKEKRQHREISFDNQKDFDKFCKNLAILKAVVSLNPSSVYELACMLNKDQSNLNKTICFFEELGVIKIKKIRKNNRTLKQPILEYDTIEFDLAR